jgi:diketogulonate reductase-like aldo/keto reductase
MGSTRPEPFISLEKKIEAKYRLLNNGRKCPIMGLGTALIKKEKDIEVVYQSIVDGVRLIDTCPLNEEFVGKGIKKAITEGIVKREELFIVTKLELEEKEEPEKALRQSLDRLQLTYVDLYLDHWPSCICINNINKYKLIPVKDTWQKMENLVRKRLTKSIGISNYNAENIFNVLSICKIKPVVNEVEFHPYLYQKDLKDLCDKEQILLFAYNPLAKGEYVDRKEAADKNVNLFNDSIICKLKEEFPPLDKGQIILNWHLRLGVVPIPGTSKTGRMKTNLKANSFSLSNLVIELIGRDEFNQYRFNDGSKIFGINIFA